MVLRLSRGRVGSRLFKVRSKGLTFFCVVSYPEQCRGAGRWCREGAEGPERCLQNSGMMTLLEVVAGLVKLEEIENWDPEGASSR